MHFSLWMPAADRPISGLCIKKLERKMNVKRIFALILSLAMVFTLASSVSAAETGSNGAAALELEFISGVNETVVAVYLKGGDGVTNGRIAVSYDATNATLLKAEKADAYAMSSLNSRTAGKVSLAWVGSKLTGEKALLLTLRFRTPVAGEQPLTFSAAAENIYAGTTLVKVSGGSVKVPAWKNPFVDINGHWAEDEILTAAKAGLFNGVEEDRFSPDTYMTRAMFVTVLYRMAGSPAAANGSATFTDVPADAYYAKAVAWAVKSGVTTGTSATTFEPELTISREQMMTFLYRYADKVEGRDTSASKDLTGFADYADVDGWARTAMSWAVAEGIIVGYPDNTLLPDANATRAETATILCRYLAY